MNSSSGIKEKIATTLAHAGFRKYFFNAGWMFAEKFLRLVAGVFIGAYVARYLEPSRFGLLNYVISIVSLISVMASLGLETIVIRELVRDERKRNIILGTSLTLRLISSFILLTLLIITVESTNSDKLTKQLIYIISCGMLVEVFGIIDYFFQAKVISRYIVWSQMIALTVISIFRILLVINQGSLTWFAWTYVIDLFIISLGLIIFYQRSFASILSWKFDYQTAKLLLTASWPMIFSALAITIYMKIDLIMIKWMLGDEATGNYSVAVRLSEMWNFIPVAICSSLFPAILNAKFNNEQVYLQRLQNLYDAMVLLAITIALPMTFLSDTIVIILFGTTYSSAGSILMIYVWSSVFVFLGVANGKWIVSENLQVFRMITLVASAVINIILNFILIKQMGPYGAAVSTLISYAFAVYFSLLITRRTRPMFIVCSRSFNIFSSIRRLSEGILNNRIK